MSDTDPAETRAKLEKWLSDNVSFKQLSVGQFARLAAQTPGTFADALNTTPTEVEDPENLPEGEVDLGDDSSIIELQNGHVDISDGSWWFKRADVARKDESEDTETDSAPDSEDDGEGEWRPYVGPEGGTGWTDGDAINYDDDFSPDPADIDDAATEEFLNRVPEDERQAAREELGIPSESAQTDSEPDVPMEEGDPRVSLESAEQAAQTLQEWDADSYEFDYWEGAELDDAVEGSVVEVADGEFQLLGDGQTAIVLDPEEQVAVTESGERLEYSNSLGVGNLLGVFDDPANQVATGQREWDSFADEVVPDAVQDAQSDESGTQTDEQNEQTPAFYDASPIGERLAESQFDSDITLTEGTTVAFGTDALEITDVSRTDAKDTFRVTDSNDEFVVSNGVVGVESSGRLPKEGAESYIEFADGAPYDSGWYQAAEETTVTDDGGPSLTLVDDDGAVVEATADVLDEMENTYTAIEDSGKVDSIQSLPEPTGSSDPAEWNVDWSETATDATADRPRLSDVQKEMFMREWRASVDNDTAVDGVEGAIRSNKNDPFTTGGQKYDKLIQSVMGVGGDPRENGFEDADDPTPAEVEAMEMFAEASREMFRQQFGDSHTAHRGLSDFAHDRLFDVIADAYAGEGEARGFEFEVEDNPASIWSTDDDAARTFAEVMNDTTMLKIDKEITPDDVFAMPESVLGFEEDEREYNTSSDWDEGEVNIPGDGFELTPEDVTVPLATESDVTLADVLSVSDSFQSLSDGTIEDAVAMMNDFAPVEVREQFADELAAADIPESQVNRVERAVVQADPDAVTVRKVGPVIDISDEMPPLYQLRDMETSEQSIENMARKDESEDTEIGVEDGESDSDGWRPYVGPEGGTGWTDGDEINYDDDFSPDPADIDEAATEEFLNRVPEDERQAAREELGIPEDGEELDGYTVVTVDELISEVGMDSMDDVSEVIARGIDEGVNLTELAERIGDEFSGRYVSRALDDVLDSAEKSVEGFDSNVKFAYDWDDDETFQEEAEARFREDVGEETFELARETLENWPLDFFAEEVAPLWQTAMSETGNENLLVGEESVRDVDVSDEQIEAVRAYKEHTEETLRDIFGDSVTLYRGVYGDAGKELQQAVSDDESIDWERRAVESYTSDMKYARSYAQNPNGAVVSEEVPVEDIWASSFTGFLDGNENEMVVANDETETIDPEDIHTPEELDDSSWLVEEVGTAIREFNSDPTTADEPTDFDSFSECVRVNEDKDDPESYCAAVFGMDSEEDTGDVDEDGTSQAMSREKTDHQQVNDKSAKTVTLAELQPINWIRDADVEADEQSVDSMARKSKTNVDALERELLNRYDGLERLHLNRRFTGRGGDFHLQLLYIADDRRGEGIGEMVVQEIVQAADRHNEIVTLNISPKDGTSESSLRRFYRQYGWEDASDRPDITADMYRPPRGSDPPVVDSNRTSIFNMAIDGILLETVPDGYEERDGVYVRKDLDVPGYDALPVSDAPPETQQFIERFVAENDPREKSPLVYEILGSGVYDYKLDKSAVNYQTYPIEGENGEVEHCGNCKFAYHSNQSGNLICSQVTAPVGWRHWCNRWSYASPDDVLSEAYPSVDADAGTPIEEVREDD